MTRVLVVGPHPPLPSREARLCARLGVEHTRAGADVLTVDRLPSAADRAVPLRGVAGAAAVAWLARGADHLDLVLAPALLQRPGARSPEHKAVAAAWGAALRVPRSARVHVLDPVDLRQLGLHFAVAGQPGIEVVEHAAAGEPLGLASSPAGPAPGEPALADLTWDCLGAAMAASASADRLAGLSLRVPSPVPPSADPDPEGAGGGRRSPARAVRSGLRRVVRAVAAGRRPPHR